MPSIDVLRASRLMFANFTTIVLPVNDVINIPIPLTKISSFAVKSPPFIDVRMRRFIHDFVGADLMPLLQEQVVVTCLKT
jgi:hypothetical protein